MCNYLCTKYKGGDRRIKIGIKESWETIFKEWPNSYGKSTQRQQETHQCARQIKGKKCDQLKLGLRETRSIAGGTDSCEKGHREAREWFCKTLQREIKILATTINQTKCKIVAF